ncbi:MAG: T9SS type A sorting domain-containing protein [Elusimicrobia bacterium]|nr:T9SS type A sorting domain-containing protein [Elusimicrobiota bacterium]
MVYSHGDYLSQPVALDTDNNHLLHVAFIDRPLHLHMSYGRAPHFSLTEIPAYSLDEAFQPNVAVGSDDHPRIAFLSNGSAVFGEWSGVGFSTETLAFGVPGREGKLDLGLGKEDRPYLLARDLDPHSYDGTYIRLAAKLPPPLSMTMSSRTATSIQWTWPTPTSNAVTGFRLRRTHDQSDLSGILPATATHWTAEGLSPNTTISADLETLFPGFVLTSGPVTAVSFAVPPKNVHLSRSGSGHLSATWSANGNTAGTTYRLDFHAPGNTVLSATANSPTHVYPFLSLQAPYALNVTALSGDGVPSPLATITSVTSDGRRTRMVFVVEELTVETTLAPLAGFAHPVFAAGPANDFPPNADSLFTPTGRGFQLEMDQPLPENQSATVAVNYPIGWLDSPSPLVLARFNTERAVWVPLPTRQEGQRLIATVDGFGLFQVMARSGNNLTISNVTAYPNPFRPGNGNTLTLKNLPPDGRAKIMTLNGQLVRSMTGNETGLTQWDGLTDDGIPVNSGVYVLAIEQNGAIEKLKVIVEQ